ncbi:15-hydroxyprostaglandin dehydrogenase [NAD(+)]-like [Crassostrea virginica]|uniref:15-hydroxyprostaglandin dehydrogenase [NAD(+)] n=1 Tax=Crassostrea virginica TaxID=6565 RepID=A0A8B8AUX1_CRAVI|nr:15-hydroxyprostaglandin dehydrogenase [NAD(+)]-like [Crassostrea virginica]
MESDRCAVITGGAQGIGRALAEEMLRNQYKVCILDMNKTLGEAVQSDLSEKFGDKNVYFFVCDVTKICDMESAVKFCIESWGRIDVFVNNAGIVNEFSPELAVSVNLTAVIRACGIVVQHMRKDKGGNGGTIINVSSVAGLVPIPFIPIYCATKSGVISYTKTLAKQIEIANQGVVLCCMCPGFTDTAFVQNLEDKIIDFPAAYQAIEKMGLLKVKTVVDGIMKLVADQKNGSLLKVTHNGTEYVTN